MATGSTPNYSFPYPVSSDPVDVAGDMEDLAQSIDSFLSSPSIELTTPVVSGVLNISGSAPVIASASVISPNAPVVFISGTSTISTINSPFGAGNSGSITLIPTGVFTTNTSGNIALASTAVVSKALIMIYDYAANKWYPSY